MDSFSSQDTDFLLASRRAFTPESSPTFSSRSVSPISFPFAANQNGAVIVDLELDDEELLSEIPETPQPQPIPISPPPIQRNNPATYRERLGIHTLRHVAGFTLDRISAMIRKPISTIGDIARQPTTPPKCPLNHILDTPARRELVIFIQADPAHRRMTLGELSHAMGYTCSESTIRRALALKNLFPFVAKLQPFISEINRARRINYVNTGITLPTFHWQNVAWTDEGHSH
jgi:hypothetical protein